MSIADDANQVWRDYEINNLPSSGPWQPTNADIRAFFQDLDGLVGAPPAPVWKLAATGCMTTPNVSLNSAPFLNASTMSVRAHTAVCQLSGVIKLVYCNWANFAGGGDYYDEGTNGFGQITGTCSVAYPTKSDVIGTASFVVQPGQNAVVLIDLSADIPAGAQFYVATFAVPAAGCGIPLFGGGYSEGLNATASQSLNTALGEAATTATSGVTDQTANPAAVTTSYNNQSVIWGPTAILALQPASTPVIVVNGDSKNAGFHYEADKFNQLSWVAQAIGDMIAVMNFSVSGKSAQADAGSIIAPCPLAGQSALTLRMQLAQLIGATDFILDLSANDMDGISPIPNSDTAATVQGYWATIIAKAQANGLRITGVTNTPSTTSTDGWVTTANQTLGPNNAQQDIFNAYVRAKPAGVSFVVDAGAAVGTGLTDAKWDVGYGGAAPWTAEGIHPYDRAIGSLIGAVNVANYAAVLPSTGLGYADTYGQGVKNVQGAIDLLMGREGDIYLGGLTGANFNSTADQAITLAGPPAFVVADVIVTNASTSLTAVQGGFYSAVGKTGALFGTSGSTSFSVLTSGSIAVQFGMGHAGANPSPAMQEAGTIYLSLTDPQGAAATADIYVFGKWIRPITRA